MEFRTGNDDNIFLNFSTDLSTHIIQSLRGVLQSVYINNQLSLQQIALGTDLLRMGEHALGTFLYTTDIFFQAFR